MQWDDIRFFLAAAQTGSLAQAGKTLGVEHTTVARRIAALEEHMGCALVRRTARGLKLTLAGQQLLARASRAEVEMRNVERLAHTFDAEVAGEVRIATSVALAESFAVPALAKLRRDHPKLLVRLVVARSLANLLNGDIDLALRLRFSGQRVAEPDVLVVRVADVDFGLYAMPAVLRAHQKKPASCPMIRYGSVVSEPGIAWLTSRLSAPVAMHADDMPTVRAAALAGVGAAILPHVYAKPPLRCATPSVDRAQLFLAMHPDLHKVPRIAETARLLRETIREIARSS